MLFAVIVQERTTPDDDDTSRTSFRFASRVQNRAPLKVGLLMVAAIGAFYLLREHWNHVAGNWVYLLLLACPLMHFFHGHGGHGRHGSRGAPPTQPGDRKE